MKCTWVAAIVFATLVLPTTMAHSTWGDHDFGVGNVVLAWDVGQDSLIDLPATEILGVQVPTTANIWIVLVENANDASKWIPGMEVRYWMVMELTNPTSADKTPFYMGYLSIISWNELYGRPTGGATFWETGPSAEMPNIEDAIYKHEKRGARYDYYFEEAVLGHREISMFIPPIYAFAEPKDHGHDFSWDSIQNSTQMHVEEVYIESQVKGVRDDGWTRADVLHATPRYHTMSGSIPLDIEEVAIPDRPPDGDVDGQKIWMAEKDGRTVVTLEGNSMTCLDSDGERQVVNGFSVYLADRSEIHSPWSVVSFREDWVSTSQLGMIEEDFADFPYGNGESPIEYTVEPGEFPERIEIRMVVPFEDVIGFEVNADCVDWGEVTTHWYGSNYLAISLFIARGPFPLVGRIAFQTLCVIALFCLWRYHKKHTGNKSSLDDSSQGGVGD